MSARSKTLALVAATGLVLAGGCADGGLDDGDAPDAIIEVETMNIPPANSSLDSTTGACTITVTNVSATLRNRAVSTPGAGSPFNDVVLETVTITYAWDDPALVTAPRTFDIGGTVPVGGAAQVQFAPIAFGDLDATMVGHTASLNMTFSGRSISGARATADAGGTFSVGGSCAP